MNLRCLTIAEIGNDIYGVPYDQGTVLEEG